MKTRLVAVLLVLGTLLNACGGGRPEPTAEELMQAAANATEGLSSVHFILVIDGGPAYLDAGRTLNLRHAEGDVARPDRAQAVAKVAVDGFMVNIKFIHIGSDSFMTEPISGRWGAPPVELRYDAAALFDAEHGVSATLRRIEGLTRVGSQRVDGEEAYRLAGEVNTEHLMLLTGGVLPGDRVKADVWVAKDGMALRQIRLTEMTDAEKPMTWTLNLTRHDEPVTIEPPL